MILFFGADTIWRLRLAEALAAGGTNVLAYRFHTSGTANLPEPRSRQGLGIVDMTLPRGWATVLALPVQYGMSSRIWARHRKDDVDFVVVPTPHYLPLARALSKRWPVLYHGSDDYRSYAGWDPAAMARQEAALVALARWSVFVSRALADRAIREYGASPTRVHVVPNATEPRFLASQVQTGEPSPLEALPRPIVGVVGGIGARVDERVLLVVARLSGVGRLVLVGPSEDPELAERLQRDPKIELVGPRPHGELHRWTRAFDVALIPYKHASINYYCSPMRLFDHLASGWPVFATDACPQCGEFAPPVTVAAAEALPRLLDERLRSGLSAEPDAAQLSIARAQLWEQRAAAIVELARYS
jgi:hypothetical protein